MNAKLDELNLLSNDIIESSIEVHKEHGSGLMESLKLLKGWIKMPHQRKGYLSILFL